MLHRRKGKRSKAEGEFSKTVSGNENEARLKSSSFRDYSSLPLWEISICAVVWISCYASSVYQTFVISQKNKDKYFTNGLLEKGWISSLNTYKDSSDDEWSAWNKWLWSVVVQGFCGHFVIARIADVTIPAHRFEVMACYGAAFCWYIFGWFGFTFILSHFIVQYSVAVLTNRTYCCWISGILLLYTLNNDTFHSFLYEFYEDEDIANKLMFTTAMSGFRYLSFSLDYVQENRKQEHRDGSQHLKTDKADQHDVKMKTTKKELMKDRSEKLPLSFANMLTYQFYFPLLFGGPIINYYKFCEQLEKPPISWDRKNSLKFLFGIIRFSFWHLFNEVTLHYMYFNVIVFDYKEMTRMSIFALCGLSLVVIQFFGMKYVVMYGLPSHLATSDNLLVPCGPHCVTSKFNFTDLWKFFDKGLHKWLVRYVFIPLGGSQHGLIRNLVASMLPFAFVYYWHGAEWSHLVWAGMNWFGVALERTCSKYARSEHHAQRIGSLSGEMRRRIYGLLTCLNHVFVMLAGVIFTSGTEVGYLYLKRIYTENILSTFLIHVVLYCGAHTSLEITQKFRIQEKLLAKY